MIQTQLLRLDPPYQIISAGGQVGIQLATLIVTEETNTKEGQYSIDTHSHPVVSYGLKEGLVEQYKYCDGNPDIMGQLALRLQPEGAVWNKVEVNDIRVLGLAGANNELISLECFVSLVPTDQDFYPWDRVWNEKSIAKFYSMFFGLFRVGLKFEDECFPIDKDEQGRVVINLEAKINYESRPLVQVIIRDKDNYTPYDDGISFCVKLFSEEGQIDGCIRNIVSAMTVLRQRFMIKEKLFFVHRSFPDKISSLIEKSIETVTERVNAAFNP